jgi:ketosteroid isomerase-like protein
MRFFKPSSAIALFVFVCLSGNAYAATSDDGAALRNTSEAIRAAFAKGDVAAAMMYHHPDVKKALAYHKVLIGRDAVAADLTNTFKHSRLDFVENDVESLLIEGNTAVEQTLFTIKVTPIEGGEPFLFRGRAMVVYVRYKGSPTGWASIREIIQPAVD